MSKITKNLFYTPGHSTHRNFTVDQVDKMKNMNNAGVSTAAILTALKMTKTDNFANLRTTVVEGIIRPPRFLRSGPTQTLFADVIRFYNSPNYHQSFCGLLSVIRSFFVSLCVSSLCNDVLYEEGMTDSYVCNFQNGGRRISMPRGPALSDFQKGQVFTMHASETSQREIARIIGRSKTVGYAYMRNPEGYNTMRRPGRRSSLLQQPSGVLFERPRPANTVRRRSSSPLTSPSRLAPCVIYLPVKTRCAT